MAGANSLDELLPRQLVYAGVVLQGVGGVEHDSTNFALSYVTDPTTNITRAKYTLANRLAITKISGTGYAVDSGASPDQMFEVDTSVASDFKLPSPPKNAGRVIFATDVTGTAATHPFTVKRNGTEQINGSSSDLVVSTNRAMVRIECDGTNWFATIASPSAGGATIPTGSGFTHITSGAQDAAAAHGSVAGQIPIVNAGVTDAPFTAVSGDGTLSGAGVLAVVGITGNGSGFVTVAASKFTFASSGAAAGTAANTKLLFANDSELRYYDGTTSRGVLYMLGGDVYYGSYSSAASFPNNLFFDGSSTVNFRVNGTSYIKGDNASGTVQVQVPLIGQGTAWGSVNGVGTQAMADANQTLASSVYQNATIKTTGALTNGRTATIPSATDAQAYVKPFNNACTGSFSVTFTTGAGTTMAVANGKTAWGLVDSRGVTRLTPDT